MVWRFLSPDRIDCSMGYLIPSSHEMPSSLSAIKALKSVSSSPSSSASSRSACKVRRYCTCPSRTCHLRIVRKTSLLFVHPASFLRKTIWQCSGPWVLKFSVHPNIMIFRTLCRMLWALSKFQPDFSPVLCGIFAFNSSSSSTDIAWSLSRPSTVRPNRRCFHFNAAKCTSINLSLGSEIRGSLCRGDPGSAVRMESLTNLTCHQHITCYIVRYLTC